MSNYTDFNKTAEYKDEIQQKVIELVQLCNKNKMPIFVAVCTKNNEKETVYEKEMFASASNGINLKEDLLPLFVNVSNGFDTVPPREILEMNFD